MRSFVLFDYKLRRKRKLNFLFSITSIKVNVKKKYSLNIQLTKSFNFCKWSYINIFLSVPTLSTLKLPKCRFTFPLVQFTESSCLNVFFLCSPCQFLTSHGPQGHPSESSTVLMSNLAKAINYFHCLPNEF